MYFPFFVHIFQKLHYVKLPENTNGIYYINWVLTKYQINVLMAWLIIYIKLCIWVLCNQFTLWAKIANNKLTLINPLKQSKSKNDLHNFHSYMYCHSCYKSLVTTEGTENDKKIFGFKKKRLCEDGVKAPMINVRKCKSSKTC